MNLMERQWSDEYPDTFTVWVQTSDDPDETGAAYVVVSGAAVWLNSDQAAEVILHLSECRYVAAKMNRERGVEQ